MDLARRIEVIEQENDLLREHVRRLELALIGSFTTPFEWGLTPAERVVFGVLVARKLATKDAILAALYRSLGRDEAAPRIVDVFVCKLRKKITPFGVAVRTAWGSGYYVDDEVRLRFQEAV